MTTILKNIPLLLAGGILFFLLLERAEWAPLHADALLDFDVSAQCEPHADAVSPRKIHVQFDYASRVDRLDVWAGLSVDGAPFLEAEQYRFGLPDRGWLSILFPGPLYRVRHFCEAASDRKHLYMSYAPHQETRLSASGSKRFSTRELATVTGPEEPLLPLSPQGEYGNIYEAGGGTSNPYWLQVAVPVHSRHSIETTLRYWLR